MEFIKDYAISIITVSVLAVILENILPGDSNKKYIHVMIGLLVMLVILNPLTKLPHYNATFAIPQLHIGDEQIALPAQQSYIVQSFQRNLALAMNQDVRETYHKTVSCRVVCHLNEDGQITHISKVQLTPYTQEIASYLAQKYGLEEACITHE